jgi:hypothetical protein
MSKRNIVTLFVSLLFVLGLVLSAGSIASAGEEGHEMTFEGNIVCLIPNPSTVMLEAVLTTEDCSKLAPHQHVLVTKEGKSYMIEGDEETLKKMMQGSKKEVKVTGSVLDNLQGGFPVFRPKY